MPPLTLSELQSEGCIILCRVTLVYNFIKVHSIVYTFQELQYFPSLNRWASGLGRRHRSITASTMLKLTALVQHAACGRDGLKLI